MLAYSNFYIALATALLAQIAEALTDFRRVGGFQPHGGRLRLCDALPQYLPGPGLHRVERSGQGCFLSTMAAGLYVLERHIPGGRAVSGAQYWHSQFLCHAFLILLGLLYGVKLLMPARWEKFPVKLKDIPTSKTFFVPMAWAAVSSVLPYFAGGYEAGRVAYACWIVFLLSLVRTTLRDFLAIQGDRLVGKETLVVLAGEKRTAHFTVGVLAALVLTALLAAPGRGQHRVFLLPYRSRPHLRFFPENGFQKKASGGPSLRSSHRDRSDRDRLKRYDLEPDTLN